MMEKIDILLLMVCGGFSLTFGILILMWKSLNKKFNRLEESLSKLIDKIERC
jgi:hypothetical protein